MRPWFVCGLSLVLAACGAPRVAQARTDLEAWSAEGEANGCGHVARTFGCVSCCPSYCNMTPDARECLTCTAGQDGSF